MSSSHEASRWTRRLAVMIACVIALTASGCGTDNDYKNSLRPPRAIVVSASISNDRVAVSPQRFGGGPITLVITNQSTSKQQVTLESDDQPGSGPRNRPVQTGPINPRETASLQTDVEKGTYALRVDGDGVRPATVVVSGQRASSQNDLSQP